MIIRVMDQTGDTALRVEMNTPVEELIEELWGAIQPNGEVISPTLGEKLFNQKLAEGYWATVQGANGRKTAVTRWADVPFDAVQVVMAPRMVGG